MARTPKNPNVERVARVPFDKDSVSPMPQFTPRAAAGAARRELHMGTPGPTKDKAEGDRDTVSPDAERASRLSEASTANAQDLPDLTAPPPGETPRADIQDLPRNGVPARGRRRRGRRRGRLARGGTVRFRDRGRARRGDAGPGAIDEREHRPGRHRARNGGRRRSGRRCDRPECGPPGRPGSRVSRRPCADCSNCYHQRR